MRTYLLENREDMPIYEYLYKCIRDDIIHGELKAGEKLPSKRSMATAHGVSLITIENAYAQLIMEGYVEAIEKRGYFVVRIQRLANGFPNGDRHVSSSDQLSTRDGRFSNSDQLSLGDGRFISAGPTVNLSSSRIAEDGFPFSVWAKLTRQILCDKERNFTEAPPASGVWELKQAIAQYVADARGLKTDPERIIVGAGTEYLHLILLGLMGRNRFVAVEDPGYKKVGSLYESNGTKVLPIPVDKHGLLVSLLADSNVSLVHTSPSHHFPTGCVMSAERRHELIAWAMENNAYIIEDDYDSELRFEGRPLPPLSLLNNTNVIYMNTFTRTLAPSIRIAYMILPETLYQRYREHFSYYSASVSSFEQYTLAEFLEKGYYERHISRMRNFYRQKRKKVLEIFRESPLKKYATLEEEHSGLHFILHIKDSVFENGFTDENLKESLAKRGINLTDMASFCYHAKDSFRHRFLIYYASLDTETLGDSLRVVAEILKSH